MSWCRERSGKATRRRLNARRRGGAEEALGLAAGPGPQRYDIVRSITRCGYRQQAAERRRQGSEAAMSDQLHLRLLGGLSVARGDVPLRGFLTAKVQALLCYLAVTGRPHSREALATLLWGDMPEERAAHSLRQALSNLQKLVGAHVAVTRQTVTFDRSIPYTLDIEAFADRIAASAAASVGAVRRLREAADLYAGDFLAGFSVRDAPEFDDWVREQRDHLREQALGALWRLAASHRARGEYADAVTCLRRVLALDPWREAAHRQLMLLLAYQGQRDAAVAQYRECRRALADGPGEEPADATTALYRRIQAGAIKAPVREAPPNNLPIAPTPIIGRAAEIERVIALLDDPARRLLTLTGPGGIGKTRLAMAVAAELVREFQDGAYFVPLAPVREPQLMLGTIARMLTVPDSPREPLLDRLKAALHDTRMLLVFDNFEQLIPAAPLLAELLQASPHLRLLVTSRASLRLRGERVYEVPPLALPSPDDASPPEAVLRSPAAAMFVEWAQAAAPDFTLDATNVGLVVELCVRLEGLPLAIELAAARLRALSLPELLARLGERLETLVAGPRDLPQRQQTLRSTIAWSYDLLSAPLQRLFRELSVFVGGCAPEAVAAVCTAATWTGSDVASGSAPEDALLTALAMLTDSSLLRREEAVPGQERRVRMLETIREYAAKRLRAAQEEPSLRGRHAEYYAALVESAAGELQGPRQKHWMDRLELEHNNLRAALDWARASGSRELGLRMAAVLWQFWRVRGYLSEGRRWMEALLAQSRDPSPAVPPALRAAAVRGAGVLAFQQGDLDRSAELCQESLRIYEELGDRQGTSFALNSLGNVCREQGAYDEATRLYERFLMLGRELRDEHSIAVALNSLGSTAHRQGDLERAAALYAESLALRRTHGDAAGVAYTLSSLADVALDQGDLSRAVALGEEGLALNRELGYKWGIAQALTILGAAANAQHDLPAARTLCEEGLTLFQELGETWGIASALRRLGEIARRTGTFDQATTSLQESLAHYRQGGGNLWEIASVLVCLGDIARELGERARARAHYEESLALSLRIGNRLIAARCQEGLAALAPPR
jgi:predicted ATPase/DNA-binding SARP family transcriptional activator